MAPTLDPTDEQIAIIDAFKSGGNLVIEAGAGCGKSSSLRMIAEASGGFGSYISFNKAIAEDAKKSFPSNTACSTAHSIAFKKVGRQYIDQINGPRVMIWDVAAFLGAKGVEFEKGKALTANMVARCAVDTVGQFCYSDRDEIDGGHVPFMPGLEDHRKELKHLIVPLARRAWENMIDLEEDGPCKPTHDVYLKLWALERPTISANWILYDEAQDANPVMTKVITAQEHAQIVVVGDSSQQIYAWRGSVDALSKFPADHRLTLSQSFRFGPAIAVEANKWLGLLNAPLRLKGFEPIESIIGTLDVPQAILCRTNAGAIACAMEAQIRQRKAALVGGAGPIMKLAEAARDLISGKRTTHSELVAFTTWESVCEYAHSGGGADIKSLVNLINDKGWQSVLQCAQACVEEFAADVVLSTVHKAKGREWETVRIHSDFQEPGSEVEGDWKDNAGEQRLAYVAVTRAKIQLDNQGLRWVDRIIAEAAQAKSMRTAALNQIDSEELFLANRPGERVE